MFVSDMDNIFHLFLLSLPIVAPKGKISNDLFNILLQLKIWNMEKYG